MAFGIQVYDDRGVGMISNDIPMNLLEIIPVLEGNHSANIPAINSSDTYYQVMPQPFGGTQLGVYADPATIKISGTRLSYRGVRLPGIKPEWIGAWAIFVYGRRR